VLDNAVCWIVLYTVQCACYSSFFREGAFFRTRCTFSPLRRLGLNWI